MRRAVKSDEKRVVDILTQSFESNPSVLWVVKKDRKLKKRIKELCRYSFNTALRRQGVWLSSNRNGVALCYPYNAKKDGFADYLSQISLVLRAVGLKRVPMVLKRESYIKQHRPADGNFLYFWFLGVLPGHQDGKAARELKEHILNLSSKSSLPIYLETSVEKNRRVYQRFGFEVYHQWVSDDNETVVYFMRRMPD